MAQFLYNFPTTAPLGLLAALTLLGMAGVSLWRSGAPGASQRLRLVLTALLLTALGGTLLATSIHLALVQVTWAERAASSAPLPSTSIVAVILTAGITLALLALVRTATFKQNSATTAGVSALFWASFATLAGLAMFRSFMDNWALAYTAGWIMTMLSFTAFVVIAAKNRIRTYGESRYNQGRLDGLDQRVQTANSAAHVD